MSTIQVFSGDILLGADRPFSAAACRATQLVEWLQRAGHRVAVSVPRELAADDAASAYGWDDQAAVLRDGGPDAALWLDAARCRLPGHAMPWIARVCDFTGLEKRVWEDEGWRPAATADDLDLAILLSPAQRDGVRLRPGTPTLILPVACPPALRLRGRRPQRQAVVLADLRLAEPLADDLRALAAALREHGWGLMLLDVPVRTGDGAAPMPDAVRALAALPGVRLVTGATLADVAAAIAEAGALVDPLCHGEPGLMTALRHAIAAANGLPLVDWSAAHDAAALTAALAPRALANDPAAAADPPLADAALTRRCRRPRAGGRADTVLVLARADALDAQHRLVQPLTSLLRRGRIDGFSLLLDTGDGKAPDCTHYGKVDAGGLYDAVLVGGDLDPSFAQAVAVGVGRYALDLPSGVPAALMPGSLRRLARAASALSAPAVAILERTSAFHPTGAGCPAVVAPPHLEFDLPVPNRSGRPAALVIDASDGLLLGSSKAAVITALMRATERFGLPLLWFGPTDPDFERNIPAIRPMTAKNTRDLALELLRADSLLPLVPLEAAEDGAVGEAAAVQTDAAMVLYGGTGHAGVYSAVGPYTASPLPSGLLVPNTAEAWEDAIARMVEGTAAARFDAVAVRAERGVDHLADWCWEPLIDAVAQAQSVSLPALLELRLSVADLSHRLPFDEAAYLERHPDVRGAVEEGGFASGYEHFILHGYAEGRMPEFTPAETVALDALVKAEVAAADERTRNAEHLAAQVERILVSLPR